MSEDSNLSLWRQVDKTPTTAVKAANVDGQSITSLDGMHVVELATKMFGPIGIGWGYKIEDERFDQGAPIFDPKGAVVLAHEVTHTLRLVLWYKWNGEKGEVTQFGHTKYIYRTGTGKWKTDNEAPKKSVTDCIKKCLSLLGFAADVYYGKFDNKDYEEAQNVATRIAEAEDQDAEIQRGQKDYAEWLKRECETLTNKIPHIKSIEMAANNVLSRLPDKASIARVDPAKGRERITRAADEGIARIRAEQEAKKKEQQHERSTTE